MVGKKGKTVYSHDFGDGYKGTFDKDEQQHYLKKLLLFSKKKNAKYKKGE